jgi:hypothetical protein
MIGEGMLRLAPFGLFGKPERPLLSHHYFGDLFEFAEMVVIKTKLSHGVCIEENEFADTVMGALVTLFPRHRQNPGGTLAIAPISSCWTYEPL